MTYLGFARDAFGAREIEPLGYSKVNGIKGGGITGALGR